MHCYSGSLEMAYEFIKLGFYISLGGPVTFKNSKKLKRAVASIPLENIVLETDSPYQSPARDHRHEPEDIVNIYEAINHIRNISINELSDAVEKNFNSIFKI